MKKTVSVLLACAMLLAMLTACGGNDKSGSNGGKDSGNAVQNEPADQPDSDGEASALYARFAALKRAGFTEAQALELVSGKGK